MSKKYSIGVNYGTQSGRAVLVDVETGREVATAVKVYTHDVMDEVLPDGVTKLEPDWALEHPHDYHYPVCSFNKAVSLFIYFRCFI